MSPKPRPSNSSASSATGDTPPVCVTPSATPSPNATADPPYAWVIAGASFFGCAVVDGLCNSFGLLYEGLAQRFPRAGRSSIVLAGSLMSGCFMLFG